MTQNMVQGSLINKQDFTFGSWTIIVTKSHILQSRCTTPKICQEAKTESKVSMTDVLCDFCRYEKELKLPQLPEMTFPKNMLRLEHTNGHYIEFNCFDALKCVDNKNDPMKVAVAEAWQEARAENSHIKDVVKPFDWTFTTDYKGTLSSEEMFKVLDTKEAIDIEKLKVKEKILFYADVMLFEDELADNGVAQCSVKIRVMPESFFVLQRFFLRVDNLCVRINDTRLYHEADKNFILREYTNRECGVNDVTVPSAVLTDPAELCNYLPVVKSVQQKLEFPV